MELTDKIRRVYLPMTETGFYILFCLQKENHGYGITQKVKEMTDSQVSISPGTMYGTLSKMEKDGLVAFHYRSYGTFFLQQNRLHNSYGGSTHYRNYRAEIFSRLFLY